MILLELLRCVDHNLAILTQSVFKMKLEQPCACKSARSHFLNKNTIMHTCALWMPWYGTIENRDHDRSFCINPGEYQIGKLESVIRSGAWTVSGQLPILSYRQALIENPEKSHRQLPWRIQFNVSLLSILLGVHFLNTNWEALFSSRAYAFLRIPCWHLTKHFCAMHKYFESVSAIKRSMSTA